MSTVNPERSYQGPLAELTERLPRQDLKDYGDYLRRISIEGFTSDTASDQKVVKLHETACRVHAFLSEIPDQDLFSLLIHNSQMNRGSLDTRSYLEVFGDELLSRPSLSLVCLSAKKISEEELYSNNVLFKSICSLIDILQKGQSREMQIERLSSEPLCCLSVIRPLLYERPYAAEASTRTNLTLPFIALCQAARSGQADVVKMVLNKDPDLLTELKKSVVTAKQEVKEYRERLKVEEENGQLLGMLAWQQSEMEGRKIAETLKNAQKLLSERETHYLAACSHYIEFLHSKFKQEETERSDKKHQKNSLVSARYSAPVLSFLYSEYNSDRSKKVTPLKEPTFFKRSRIAATKALVEFKHTRATEFLLEELQDPMEYLGALYAAIAEQNVDAVIAVCDKYGKDKDLLALEINKKRLPKRHSDMFTHDSYTPLMIAAEMGNFTIFKELYKRYSLSGLSKQRSKVMSIAVAKGNSSILKYVIDDLRRKSKLPNEHAIFPHLMTLALTREVYPEVMETLLQETSINGNTILVGQEYPKFSCLGKVLNLFEAERDPTKRRQLAKLVQSVCEKDLTDINGFIIEEQSTQLSATQKNYLECYAEGCLRDSFRLVYPFLRAQVPVYLYPFLNELDSVSLQGLNEPSLAAVLKGDQATFKSTYETYKRLNVEQKKVEDLRLLAMSAAAAHGHSQIFNDLMEEYKASDRDSSDKKDLVFKCLMTVALQEEIRSEIILTLLNEGAVTGNTFLVGQEYPRYSCLGRVVEQYEIENDEAKKMQLVFLIQTICKNTADLYKPLMDRPKNERPGLRRRQLKFSQPKLEGDKSKETLADFLQRIYKEDCNVFGSTVPSIIRTRELGYTYLEFAREGLLSNSFPIVYPFLIEKMDPSQKFFDLMVNHLTLLMEPSIGSLEMDSALSNYIRSKYKDDGLNKLFYLGKVIRGVLQIPNESRTYESLQANVLAQMNKDVKASRPYVDPWLTAERELYLKQLEDIRSTKTKSDEQSYLEKFSELIDDINQKPNFSKRDAIFERLMREALSGQIQAEIVEKLLTIRDADGTTVLMGHKNQGDCWLNCVVMQYEVAKTKADKARADKLAILMKFICEKILTDIGEPITLNESFFDLISKGECLNSFFILGPFYRHLLNKEPNLVGQMKTDLRVLLQQKPSPEKDDLIRSILNQLPSFE